MNIPLQRKHIRRFEICHKYAGNNQLYFILSAELGGSMEIVNGYLEQRNQDQWTEVQTKHEWGVIGYDKAIQELWSQPFLESVALLKEQVNDSGVAILRGAVN